MARRVLGKFSDALKARARGNGQLNYTLDFEPVRTGLPDLLMGCLGTLFLAVCGMVIALVIGIAGVALRESRVRPVRWAVMTFVEVIRNTPFLVQIYFVFFALPLIGLKIPPTPTAIIALGLNGGAYAIEIIRGGVQSIDKGQIEAGLSLGLHKRDVFRFIVLRPALRAVYPSLTGQFIMLTLTTSIASAIAAYDLTSVAKLIENASFRSFEVYGTITVMYLIMSWLIMRIFGVIRYVYFSYPVK